jgi:prevent-host-death family protein
MHIAEFDCLANQIGRLKSIPLQRSAEWTKLIKLSPHKNAMQTFNIHEAKTHLSRLVEQAAKGESFVIAKAGKPLVKVMPLNAPEAGQLMRLGFMDGQIAVPDDFDRMGGSEIEQLFGGDA